ncbi:MAG: M67 family metallopeptidase [Chloroflexota bacterium]|nr:M67 family metallopeptidase [Chloroflexota bacterium]
MKGELPAPADWSAAAEAGMRPAQSGHGGEGVMISADLLQAIIDAARAGLPNEACGVLVGSRYAAEGGVPERYVPLRNAAESPYRYLIDPDQQLRVMLELDDADEVVWGIVHSHVASPAVPSATDVGLAFYPDSVYLICSLAEPVPQVRAWSIREGAVTEVSLAVG